VTPDEIRGIPLFADVSDAGAERIAARAGEMSSAAGQVLALQGDPGSGMFVVLDGTVSVELRGGAVELGPGDFFGELTLLAPGGTRMARVRASSAVRCLGIPRDDATALIETEPSVALTMLKEIARRFASAVPDS
jgi:CRP-like cAMP-binding protein